MNKFLAVATAALTLSAAIAVPNIASAGGWHGGGRINGWGIVAIAGGLTAYELATTHVECQLVWNGYQNVRQCLRVANQPRQPTVVYDNDPSSDYQPTHSGTQPDHCSEAIDNHASVEVVKLACGY